MAARSRSAPPVLLLTCEHATNRIPAAYAARFRGARAVLDSHRGWDPGALAAARTLARRLGAPLLVHPWSRLLVEANRAPTNPRIWSDYTRDLPRVERERILDRWWWPHRRAVEAAVAAAPRGRRVLHVAVHSFTPVLDGVPRTVDVGLLHDPARAPERQVALAWQEDLAVRLPDLRVRRNQPYRGATDGLPTWLRRRHPPSRYAGFELELGQGLLAGPRRAALIDAVAASLAALLGGRALATPRGP